MVRHLLAIVSSLVLANFVTAQQTWRTEFQKILERPEYHHGRWGIFVVDAANGETLYEHNADTFFAPASVTKLFSCSAALLAYGPEHRFITPVFMRGELDTQGTLKGDLILIAKGDLTFGSRRGPNGETLFENNDHSYADGTSTETKLTDTDPLYALKELARQVKEAGVKTITGEVYIDGRLFTPARGTGSGPAAISPMIVNDNVIDVIVTPGAEVGSRAIVTTRPNTSYLQADFEVTTAAKTSKPVFNELDSDPRSFVLRGQIPQGSEPIVGIIPINRPLEFARTLFIECLRAEGIQVEAKLVDSPSVAGLPKATDYSKLSLIASYQSEPFSEQIKVTMKVSMNLYASTLPCLIGAKEGKTTLRDGMRAQGKLLKELGLDLGAISFGGGAGGSVADHVTPRVTVQLISAMKQRPEWESFHTAFPILGVDGTLATIVGKDSPVRGKVFAKTGTLSYADLLNDAQYLTSKALAGTMTTRTGKQLHFAMFVNDVPLPNGVKTRREGVTLGQLCEVLYEQ